MSEIAKELHWIWLGLAVLFGTLELALPFFGFIFAAAAALVAAVCAALHVAWEWQCAAFALALIASLLVLRPRIIKKLHASSSGVPSRTAALVGHKGTIAAATDTSTGLARAVVDGQDWAVRGRTEFAVGATVVVESADGLVLLVRKADT